MNTDTQTHEVCDEDEPFIGPFFVGLFIPFEDEPKNDGGEEGRGGIDLSLDGREPERVTERVRQCTYGACTEQSDAFPETIRLHEFLRERRDRPEKEEDREGTGERR